MADGANETMEVFGEAFMRLVRERLRLKISTALSGGKVHLTIMLVDEIPVGDYGQVNQQIIHSETITLEVTTLTVTPTLAVRNGY